MDEQPDLNAPAAGSRLASATSLYLRLHAQQPVAWWPWGDAPFQEARRRDVPVILSVGYATCHWCHVMARESFDDPLLAEFLNDHFVSIKVDREARPDVDAVYMNALQALTQGGGWPMTVALDHHGRPWWAGTYFPPNDRAGMPSFRRVLEALHSTWSDRREEVLRAAVEIEAALAQGGRATPRVAASLASDDAPLPSEQLAGVEGTLLAALQSSYDAEHGGFGGAPKFPPHAALRYLEASRSEAADLMRHRTLRALVDGGVSDQIGGALHRYAVDGAWAVPHFEVMLVDQAQMLPRYARAARDFDDPRLGWGASALLRALERDLLREDGLFATGLDAEAGGVEGRFHTWIPEELRGPFDAAEAAEVAAHFGIYAVGQLEGRSVLSDQGREPDPARVERWREQLLALRNERPAPHRDEPAISAYNGMMFRGLLEAAEDLDAPDAERARSLARRGFDRLLERAFDGRRIRRSIDMPASDPDHGLALLDDQVHVGLAAFALYRSFGEAGDLAVALDLADVVQSDYALPEGGFATVPLDTEAPLVRVRDALDGATPASEGAAAWLLAEAARWTLRDDLRRSAEAALAYVAALAPRAPTASVGAILAARLLRRPRISVALVGDASTAAVRELQQTARAHPSDPCIFVLSGAPSGAPWGERLPWLAHRSGSHGVLAYPCSDGVCRLPVADAASLAAELDALHLG
jgi:uncharacterized protein YyaL (SSP411 family)